MNKAYMIEESLWEVICAVVSQKKNPRDQKKHELMGKLKDSMLLEYNCEEIGKDEAREEGR